jgi:hypothetical protein
MLNSTGHLNGVMPALSGGFEPSSCGAGRRKVHACVGPGTGSLNTRKGRGEGDEVARGGVAAFSLTVRVRCRRPSST